MIREIYHFFRYGPKTPKRQKKLDLVEFLKATSKELDDDGYAELRTSLVGDIEGIILEIGTGTGATFPYYAPQADVTAIEPDSELRAAAEDAAKGAGTEIRVLPGVGEELPFEAETFDGVSGSLVLCRVTSPSKTLGGCPRMAIFPNLCVRRKL